MTKLSERKWFIKLRRWVTRAKRKEAKAAARAWQARVEGQIAHLEGVRAQWERSLPQFLRQADEIVEFKAVIQRDTQQNFKEFREPVERLVGELQMSVQQLWRRLEFIREETLLEVRYGAKQHSGASDAKIIDPAKLARLTQSGLRLNLGCGHMPMEGFLNVDGRELPGVDVISQVDSLPFEQGTVREIFSAHMLEHFPQEEIKRRLLPYWFALLATGGEFRAVVPDGAAMLKGVADGSYSFEDFRAVLFGGQDYGGDFHYNLFTPETLSNLLREAGFVDVRCLANARQNGRCFEFEITATKP